MFSLNHVMMSFLRDTMLSLDDALEMLSTEDRKIFLDTLETIDSRFTDWKHRVGSAPE